MPDDHSEVVPLLPIPNRTVKRLSADDSADSRVKVGHCQAIIREALVFTDEGFSLLRLRFISVGPAWLVGSNDKVLHWSVAACAGTFRVILRHEPTVNRQASLPAPSVSPR